ncbi:hypothetical protein ACFVS9_28360 [Streptomyces sp. NPDC058008]
MSIKHSFRRIRPSEFVIRGKWFDFTGVDAQKLIEQAAKSFRGAGQ